MFKALLLALVATAVIAVPAYAKSPGLTGEVGPGFSVEVNKAGRDVKTIKAGTYRLHVEDKSSIHNFHLIGPGVNKKTGVSFTGETTWTVKLKPGRYTYQCDVHVSDGMVGHFRVTR